MFFHEIGLLLKNKREEKSISQGEVASKLKIPLRSIIAIENGKLDELPHEVYVRTFLKGYATYIGFSTEEVRTVFSDIDDFKEKEDPPKSLEAKRAETQPEGTKSKSMQFTMQLLLVALLGASAYFYYAQNGRSETFNFNSFLGLFKSDESESVASVQVEKNQNDQKGRTQNQAILVNVNNEGKQLGDIPNTEKTTQDTNTVEPANNGTVQNGASQDMDGANEKNAMVSTAPNQGSSFDTEKFATFAAQTPEALIINWDILPKVNEGQQQAVIHVSQDCWMSAVIDGQSTNFTLKKGSQKGFVFNNTLQLKLANASAVILFHNRKLVDVGDSTALRTINLEANTTY